jgi:hypothetical protein
MAKYQHGRECGYALDNCPDKEDHALDYEEWSAKQTKKYDENIVNEYIHREIRRLTNELNTATSEEYAEACQRMIERLKRS